MFRIDMDLFVDKEVDTYLLKIVIKIFRLKSTVKNEIFLFTYVNVVANGFIVHGVLHGHDEQTIVPLEITSKYQFDDWQLASTT